MQTGGMTSTAGGAALARALQRQSDTKKLERQARAEARRQKRGSLFGSIGSLAGGLLGAALAPVTGGASLAIAAGLGSAAGKRIGEGLGAGKTQQYDRSGTVYGQEAFRDVQQASRDYNRGMGERALLAGLQTGLTAGFAPGGGIYGKVGGKLRTLPMSGGVAPVAAPIADTTLMDSLLQVKPTSSFTGGIPLSDMGSSFSSSAIDFNQPYSLSLYEDGGLAGYQNGGYTASGILKQAGLTPTEEQLKLFQQFDPTQIQQAKTGAEQSLLSMTGGMGLSSAGGGFGARQRAATSAIGAGQDLIGDTTEQAQRAFESQTLGTAADLMAGGAEFGNNNSGSSNYPRVEQMPMVNLGHSINYNGQNYVWSEEEGAYIPET
mgnify:CR=1 FL=1